MRTRILVLAVMALLIALPTLAAAQQLFDFLGQANVPVVVGNNLTMYSVVRDPAPGTTPIPLDFDNYEYTLVITDLRLDVDGVPQLYSGGTITLYEDAATPADYTNPATFVDGTAILSGTVNSMSRQMYTATLGSATGTVDWTGGTRIGEFAASERINWPLVVGISRRASDIQPGYDEAWDGKVEPREPIAVGEQSWGALKGKY
jgi:hypothetical protein